MDENIAYDITEGAWRVTATYLGEGPDARIEFFHNGEPFQAFEYPAYKIWNIAAHLHDIVADFEHGLALASTTGLGGSVQ